MCGISGVIVEPGQLAESSLTQAMARDMAHRGPDAQTEFTRENFSFSHRRLKIIDLSENANQPIFNEREDLCIIFNGEVYNFRELRKVLLDKGHTFRTQSDTEVIVHAFEEWGTESFAMLNGIFAVAIWDGRGKRNQFYLVRDRMGAKPLFYASSGLRLGFSSELKPLLRLPWVGKDINPQTLYEFLKFSHVPNPSSILSDIAQLEPGHYLHLGEKLSKHSYWDSLSEFDKLPGPAQSRAEWEEKFAACLKNVTLRQVVSDVPVGCFLSGGIDSSLLAMAFSDLGGKKVNTFSIGYREKEYDESGYARQVADIFGTQHREVIAVPQDFFSIIPKIPIYFDQPFADPSLLPTMLLSRFAREHVTVALSGDGADELFWGYDYQRALSKLRGLRAVPSLIRRGAFSFPGTRLLPHRTQKILDILQFKNDSELFSYFIGTAGPLRLDRLASVVKGSQGKAIPKFDAIIKKISGLSWNDKIAYLFQNTFLPDTVLAKTDRASMAFGLEARVPFLDNEMLDFSRDLPFEYKFSNGENKSLLRSVLSRRVPPEISARPKRGFGVPLEAWLRKDLRYLLDEYIFSDRYANDPFLENKSIQNLAKEHLLGWNHSHLLWSIINFRMWGDSYLGRT
ncbi:MAG: asparagine synthase (glutamine-hydrolyzing) [Bdellovibrionota bacterium]